MGLLLLLVGLLAVASGGFKMSGRVRSLVGSSRLAVAEILLGSVTILGSGVGLSTVRPLAWTAVVSVLALVVVSSFAHARRAMLHRRSQEQSEATRLKNYIKVPPPFGPNGRR